MTRAGVILGAAALIVTAANGEVASSNRVVCVIDQSVVYRENEMHFRENPGKGALTALDFSRFPPEAREIAEVPGTVVGPPTSVAVTPDKRKAIVTSAMIVRVKSDGSQEHIPDTRVSLVDLDAGRVLAEISVGRQPSGVAIAPDGETVYVANRAEGTISILKNAGDSLIEAARVAVAEATDSLSHVEASPDGRYLIATLTERGEILLLKADGKNGLKTVTRIASGQKPYAARFFPEGQSFAVADIETDRVTLFEIRENTAEAIEELKVGRLPEGVDISADGTWMAVSCFEGGNLTDADHPKFGQPARIHLFRKEASGRWAPTGRLKLEGVPQFAVFSPDGKYLTVSLTGLRRVEIFKREQDEFVRTDVSFAVPGEPVAAGR